MCATYVADHWNVFDFLVVTASFVPALRGDRDAAALVRLARIVRIVRFLPDLRLVIGAIGRSIPGVASLAAATGLLIFIYGMLGWVFRRPRSGALRQHRAGDADDVRHADVGELSRNVAMGQQVSQWTVLFFISYAVIMSFLIFNLFIGLVLGAMEEARAADRAKHETDDLLERLRHARDSARGRRAGVAAQPPRRPPVTRLALAKIRSPSPQPAQIGAVDGAEMLGIGGLTGEEQPIVDGFT